jgi:CheY-like chemotaxis protein
MLRGETTWDLLATLKREEQTAQIPVLVVSNVEDEQKGLMLGAEAYCLKPISRSVLLDRLDALLAEGRVLVVDDNEVARYLIGKQLDRRRFALIEARNGAEALQYAAECRPDIIILDLMMPGVSGYEVLAELKKVPAVAEIPVIIHSSLALDPDKYEQLSSSAVAVIAKNINPGLALGRIVEQVLKDRPAKRHGIHDETMETKQVATE